MSKYIEFEKVPFKGKTKRFEVVSKSSGDILGRIQWHAQWRQYCFSPSYPTVWNNDCLHSLRNFLTDLMIEWKTDQEFKNRKPRGKYVK